MDNPFKKRRTELITDRRTLLSLVSSVPIEEFFEPEKKQLLEKLTLVVGTPGCGKTTIAQVVEFESLYNLCLETASPINRDLVDVLTGHELIKDGLPAILGHRLAMSTNFREIWELGADQIAYEGIRYYSRWFDADGSPRQWARQRNTWVSWAGSRRRSSLNCWCRCCACCRLLIGFAW